MPDKNAKGKPPLSAAGNKDNKNDIRKRDTPQPEATNDSARPCELQSLEWTPSLPLDDLRLRCFRIVTPSNQTVTRIPMVAVRQDDTDESIMLPEDAKFDNLRKTLVKILQANRGVAVEPENVTLSYGKDGGKLQSDIDIQIAMAEYMNNTRQHHDLIVQMSLPNMGQREADAVNEDTDMPDADTEKKPTPQPQKMAAKRKRAVQPNDSSSDSDEPLLEKLVRKKKK